MGEVAIAAVLCSLLAGSVTEARHGFDTNGVERHVRVDCETATHVIEIALDETSSARDSVHQAIFSAYLTRDGLGREKIPAVVVIDRDGFEGRYELELRQVTSVLGVAYGRCPASAIERWAATAGMRRIEAGLDDLPGAALGHASCDLSGLAAPEVTGVTSVSGPQESEEH